MRKKYQKSISIFLIGLLFLSMFSTLTTMHHTASAAPVPESRPLPNETYLTKESLQPYGTNLHIDELKHWSPDKDPDARYNRASIPLQDRHMGPLVNPNASPEAKVMSLATTNPRASEGRSQGGQGVDTYAFTYFQYVDTYNYWGGSTHEGIIAIPTPEHIDSAHRNGVKVTGTIFFPWGDPEFVEEAMIQFTEQDDAGNFIIADKLFEIAEYYGFEGFFINQESSIRPELAEKLKEMLVYIQENKPEDFIMQWYDSMLPNGNISYQNGVNDRNIRMIQDDGQRINDEVFLNFNWNRQRIDTSIETMEQAGRSPYDVFATWEYIPYSKDPGRVEDLIDENGVIRTSLGILSPTTTLTNATSPEDFQNVQDGLVWVGPSYDPTNTERDPDVFPGFSSLVADRTPILGKNFVTHFTAGHGYHFYENGVITGDASWTNRSLTDVLPTWRWIVESDGSKLTPSIDYDDAFFAGTSLSVDGTLEAEHPNHIKLYSSRLDVTEKSQLSITYKAQEKENNMYVGLDFGNSYNDEDFVFFKVEDGETGIWNTVTIDLSEYDGKVVNAISLKFDSKIDVEDFKINIGKLAITEQLSKPGSISSANYDEIMFQDDANAEARIFWEEADHAALYLIHRVKPDGNRVYIGATPGQAFYIPPFTKEGDETGFDFEITPVNEMGERGTPYALYFEWSIPENTSEHIDTTVRENHALGQPAVSNLPSLADGPVHNINDGVIPLSKWGVDGNATPRRPHIATIDLGEEKEIRRWVVQHANAPGAGESPEMNTIDFQFRYAPDDGQPLLDGDTEESRARVEDMIFEVADEVMDNRSDITDRNLDEPIQARYIQLYITNSDRSPWKATRVYEFEVYSERYDGKTEPINMQFVKAKNNEGPTDTVTLSHVTEGDTVYLYESLMSEEPIASKEAPASGIVEFTELDFGQAAGRIYYSVKNPNYEESIRRSVPYASEFGEGIPIPEDENILLELSLKGRQLDGAQKYGVLTINDLPEGAQIEVYTEEDQVFPDLLSAPAKNGKAFQERIPLNDDGGQFYVEIHKEGVDPSERFTIQYGNVWELPGNKSGLRKTIAKYSKLDPERYISSTWETFRDTLNLGSDILDDASANALQIATVQEDIKLFASQLLRKGNLRPLVDLYAQYQSFDEALYTTDTWEHFIQVLEMVEQMIENNDSRPLEIETAIQQLEDTVNQLEFAQLTEIILEITDPTLKRTKTTALSLIGVLDNGFQTELNMDDVAFMSSNPTIAQVDEDGVVTGVKVGTAELSATYISNGEIFISNEITVSVEPLEMEGVEGFTLSYRPSITEVGEDVIVTITAEQVAHLAGFDVQLKFDSDRLTFKNFTTNETFDFSDATELTDQVHIIGTMLGSTEGISGDVDLVQVVFTAKDQDGLASIHLLAGSQLSDVDAALYTSEEPMDEKLPIANSDITGGGTAINDLVLVAQAFDIEGERDGYDERLDMNKDGVIDIIDIAYVAKRVLNR